MSGDKNPFKKGSALKERISPRVSNFFLSELTHIERGDKTKSGKVVSLESAPTHLKLWHENRINIAYISKIYFEDLDQGLPSYCSDPAGTQQ